MKNQFSKLMTIGVVMFGLGMIETASAQIPMCPPFCQQKTEAKAKKPARAKQNQQKKEKKSGKDAA